MIIHNPVITGSFQVNGTSVSSIGQVDTISGSVDRLNSATSSYALKNSISGAFDVVSSSLASRVASQESFSSSLDNTFATDADLNLVSSSVDSLNAATSSYALKTEISGSFTSLSASLSTRLTNDESSVTSLNAATSSYLQNTTDTLTGDLTVTGTLTAQDLHVQEVTSSIVYSSGSNIFGESTSDTQTFYGSNIFNGNIYISSSIPAIYLSDLQQQDWTISNDNGDIRFYQSDDAITAMYISSSGNVGFGTTSPNYKLEVQQTSTNAALWVQTGGTTNSYTIADFRTGTNASALTIKGDGIVGIGTTSPTANYPLTLRSRSGDYTKILDWGTDVGGSWGTMQISLSSPYATELRSGAWNFAQGNVGIGTTSPNAILHAGSTGTNAYSSTITKGSNMKGIVNTVASNTDDMVGIYFGTGTTTEGTHWSGITGARSDSSTHWGTQLNFYTHNNDTANINDATQKMVIMGDGNVGIGTTSPAAFLHVKADTGGSDSIVRFQNTNSTAKSTRIQLMDYSGAIGDGLITYNHSNADSQYHYLGLGLNNDTTLVINNNDYVGIGTTNPQTALTLPQGTGAANKISWYDGTPTFAASIYANSSNDTLTFATKNASNVETTALTLDISQNASFAGTISAVGASTFTLNDGVFIKAVNGTSNIVSTNVWGYGLYEGASKIGEISLVRDGSVNQMYIGTTTANQVLRIGSDNKVTAITIDASQRVGISSTSPSARLELGAGGFILKGSRGLFSPSYTADGLFNANALPNFIAASGYSSTYNKFSGQSGLILGYKDNGAGLYSPAYGFEVKSTDGIPVAGRVVDALVMHDVDTDAQPWIVQNNGNTFISNTDPKITLTRSNNAGSPAGRVSFATAGGTVRWQIATNQAVGTGFEINQGDAASNRFYIDTNGNVGIGTTSPATKLHVHEESGEVDFTIMGNGARKQHIANKKTAGSSGASIKLFYVGHTHSIRLHIYAIQSTGNVAVANAEFTTAYGSSSGGVTYSSAIGNVTGISMAYNNSGSPAYTIDITLTYSGAAPIIYASVEGISNDIMYTT